MSDKRVLLCCGAGMSSGFLATATAKPAMAKGYKWDVMAKNLSIWLLLT